MISHEHHVIFVHVPKAAGTSVEAALGHHGPHGVVRGVQDHRTLRQMQWPRGGMRQLTSLDNGLEVARAIKGRVRPEEHPANRLTVTREQYARYFKFAIVRNPWARAYSWYQNALSDPLHRRRLGMPADVGFTEFVDSYAGIDLLQPQPRWLIDFTGRIGVDVVCRFETLETDYLEVCRRARLPELPLPKLNPSSNNTYVTAYDNRARRIIAERHRQEIELFGYTFDR